MSTAETQETQAADWPVPQGDDWRRIIDNLGDALSDAGYYAVTMTALKKAPTEADPNNCLIDTTFGTSRGISVDGQLEFVRAAMTNLEKVRAKLLRQWDEEQSKTEET